MLRTALICVCLLGLTGCEAFSQLAWWYVEHGHSSEPGNPSVTPSAEQLPSKHMLLDDGRLLEATWAGLQVVDVRDPEHPKLEGSYPVAAFSASFYVVGDHVLFLPDGIYGYTGERADLDLTRETFNATILNINIRDRAHPKLVEQIELPFGLTTSFVRHGPQGSSLFLAEIMWSNDPGSTRFHRYDLRDGMLVEGAPFELEGAVSVYYVSPTSFVAAMSSVEDGTTRIAAVDVTGSAVYSAPFASDAYVLKLDVAAQRVRVLSSSDIEGTLVRTYDLLQLDAGPSGACILDSALQSFTATMFSARDASLYISTSEQLQQVRLDASGNCQDRSTFGPGSGSYQVLEVAEHRLLGLGAGALSLYDTNATALLARAELAFPYSGSEAAQVIQQLPLRTPSAAADGTPERQLVGLSYYGTDPVGRFQLLTFSDHTLTARAAFTARGVPQAIKRVGDSFVSISTTDIVTRDATDLDAVRERGEIELDRDDRIAAGSYDFDGFRARVILSAWYLYDPDRIPWYDSLQTLPLEGNQPIAKLQLQLTVPSVIRYTAFWSQVGDLMLNFGFDDWNPETQQASTYVQFYDLSDPARPRRAGRLMSDELGVNWRGTLENPDPYLRPVAVGPGLVFVHWSGKPYESTLAFDPVDVSDPDRPALLPSFALPGDFLLDGYFVSGSRIYVTERAGTSLVGSFADFSALDQPTHSTRREVPGQVVAAAQETVYTSTASASGLTLSRLDWQAETAPLTAAHEWSGRRLAKVLLDDSTQRLYVVHAPSNSATGGPSSHLDWHHLDILDAETLAVLSSIELDNFSSPPPTLHLSGGTLDIQLPYFAVLHVDIRDPSEPKVLGATSLYN